MPDLSADYHVRLIVGMEIHVELATRSKLWTAAPNVAHGEHHDAGPNTLLDPVVIGMPGTLPVMNRAAVEMAIQVGLALDCSIAHRCKWDRKSYYYPDLPKNYQISQYDQPLCFAGALDVPVSADAQASDHAANEFAAGEASSGGRYFETSRVDIIRAHLEEDAGKLLHEAPGGRPIDHSIVDLNRAGTPLLEIVTQPQMTSADQAVSFGQTLRDICRHLGVTAGVMQRGHMRFEPNINLMIEDAQGRVHKTPIVEIKNLNSFRALRGAIEHEQRRQLDEWLETGVELASGSKRTRGWDDQNMVTFAQREKEEAQDYRYFPDPDLVEYVPEEKTLDRLRGQQPELPLARLRRYIEEAGLTHADARTLIDEPALCRFFDEVVDKTAKPRRVAALLLNSGLKLANERGLGIDQLGIETEQLARIIELQDQDKIGSNAADQLIELCSRPDNQGKDAADLAQANDLLQVSDTDELDKWIDDVLSQPTNAGPLSDIRAGKDKAVGALIGQVMKQSRGSANPKLVRERILAKLKTDP